MAKNTFSLVVSGLIEVAQLAISRLGKLFFLAPLIWLLLILIGLVEFVDFVFDEGEAAALIKWVPTWIRHAGSICLGLTAAIYFAITGYDCINWLKEKGQIRENRRKSKTLDK